jgi:hypothetical protein
MKLFSQSTVGVPKYSLYSSLGISKGYLSYVEGADLIELLTGGELTIRSVFEDINIVTAHPDASVNVVTPNLNIASVTNMDGELNIRLLAGTDADKVMLIAHEGTNGGVSEVFSTDRVPQDNILAIPSSVAFRSDDEQSAMYLHKGATPSNSDWYEVSVNPEHIVEIFNSSDLDLNISGVVSTTGEVITVTGNLVIDLKNAVANGYRFVLSAGGKLTIKGNPGIGYTYTGTETLFSGGGSGARIRFFTTAFNSSSTGTLFDLDNFRMDINNMNLQGWDDLGQMTNCFLRMTNVNVIQWGIGFRLYDDISGFKIQGVGGIANPSTGSLFTIDTTNSGQGSLFDCSLDSASADLSLLDIKPTVHADTSYSVTDCEVVGGQIFKQATIANDIINTVADGSPSTGSITGADDNGDGGTTISTSTVYYEGEYLRITGTSYYDAYWRIFNVVEGVSFDIRTAFTQDEVGSVHSERIFLGLPSAHGIQEEDNISIIKSNYYNGFYNVLNVNVNEITVNATFIDTDSCEIVNDVSINQGDPRVDAFNNKGFRDSNPIGNQNIQRNTALTTPASNGVYTDMVFTGSTGDIVSVANNGSGLCEVTTSVAHGLVENQNIKIRNTTRYNGVFRVFNVTVSGFDINIPFELTATGSWDSKMQLSYASQLFKITDQDTGEMEFLGDSIAGEIPITFEVSKVGSAETYFFALAINGTVPDGFPFSTREVTSGTGSLSLLVPIALSKGDIIKPQVAGMSSTNDITIEAMSMNIIGS